MNATCTQCGKTYNCYGRNKKLCKDCIKPPKKILLELDEKQLKTLIYLCHPDKHNNSKTSNETFKFLRELK